MIKLSIRNNTYQFYEFIPREWLRGTMYVSVSICKIRFPRILELGLENFKDLDENGLANYGLGELCMTIFNGSIDYQMLRKGDIGLTLVNDDSRNEIAINHKAEEGWYIMLISRLLEANEDTYSEYDVNYIPSIAIAEFGLYAIESILFSDAFELTWIEKSKSFFNTLQLTLTSTGLIPKINNDTMWSLAHTYYTLKNIETSNVDNSQLVNRVKLSLNWFLLSIESSNVNKLISIWVAIEALILDGVTDLKPLRYALSNAYHIPVDKVEVRFYIGRIFRLRSNAVHKGHNFNIPEVMIEYLSCLYKDLLNYTLQLPCKNLSDNYIKETPHFVEYIISKALL